MNEQEIERKIEERWGRRYARRKDKRFKHHGGRFVGLFLLIVGGLLLAKASGVLFPTWFFSWPMLLIGFGLLSGVRHGFRGGGWFIPVVIGGVFLADRLSPDLQLKPYLWPIALIVLGLLFLLRPRGRRWNPDEDGNNGFGPSGPTDAPPVRPDWQSPATDGNDVIDATAVFGGVKKNVVSKDLKGGDITAFMGGAEINLLQADFNGRLLIDCFNMFGGTKLIIPADWKIQSDLTVIFGGVEDKRPPTPANPDKVLYLDGTCLFGGIEIKSY